MRNQTDFKMILSFHALVLGKSDDEKRELAKIHNINFEEYKKRIKGKEKEAEFLLILRLLKALKHVVAYDEEISKVTDEFTSDYQIELVDGYKMLVEVKHTDKDAFKISSGNLEKRIAFANDLGIPLRFAISIKGYWGLFTSEYLQEKKGEISFSDYIENNKTATGSLWDWEFETCSYLFPPGMKIKSVYAKNHPKSLGVRFEPYGELVSYEIYYQNKKIIRVKGRENYNRSLIILLEALHDRLSNSKQEIFQSDGFTTVIEESSDTNVIAEYKFLLSIIEHIELAEGFSRKDNISSIYTEKKENFDYPTFEYIRIAMSILVENGLDIMVFKGDKGYWFEDYKKEFWTKGVDEKN